MWELRPPPPLDQKASHMLGRTSLILLGELSFRVLLQNHCDDPKPVLRPCHRTSKRLSPHLTS